MPLPAPIQMTFPGDEARYVTYNLLDGAWLHEMAILLRADEPGRILLLSGAAREDQRYLLDSAAYAARRRGSAVRVAEICLDAFEPGGQTATEYVRQVLREEAVRDSAARDALRQAAEDTARHVQDKLNIDLAAGFSLSLSLGQGALRLLRYLARTDPPLGGPDLRDGEILHFLMRELTEDAQLVLLLPHLESLPQPLLSALTHNARLNRRVVLAFSCTDAEHAQVGVWGEPVTMRMVLRPLDAPCLRTRLEEQFPGNRFDAGFRDRLLRSTAGSPWVLAGLLQWLATHEVINRPTGGGAWEVDGSRWSEGDEGALDAIFPLVSRDMERVDELRTTDDVLGPALRELILRCAVCGPVFPVRVIAETVGAVLNEFCSPDALLQALDKQFGDEAEEPGNSLFQSYDYSHPGFPGTVLVYGFRDDITRVALRALALREQRQYWASEILTRAQAAFPVRTRGAAQLMMQLARETGDAGVLEFWEQSLAWWVAAEDAVAVQGIAARALENGTLNSETLWAAATQFRGSVSTAAHIALLNALEEHGLPADKRGVLFWVRAELHTELGNHINIVHDLRCALNACRGDDAWLALIHEKFSGAHFFLKNHRAALRHAQVAHEIASRIVDADPELTMMCHFSLGRAKQAIAPPTGIEHLHSAYVQCEWLREEGHLQRQDPRRLSILMEWACAGIRWDESIRMLSEIEEQAMLSNGEFDLLAISAAHRMSRVLMEIGRLEEARAAGERSLALCRRTFGDEAHHTLVAIDNLACVFELGGDYARARSLRETLLQSLEFSPDVPPRERVTFLSNYVTLLTSQRDLQLAHEAAERLIPEFNLLYGAGYPNTLLEVAGLAEIKFLLDDRSGADELVRQLLDVVSVSPARTHPITLTACVICAKIHLSLGNPSSAAEVLPWVVDGLGQIFGREDPQTVRAIKVLAYTRRELGDYSAACGLMQEVVDHHIAVFGHHHPWTLAATKELEGILLDAGQQTWPEK
jgi:hypothetical protein